MTYRKNKKNLLFQLKNLGILDHFDEIKIIDKSKNKKFKTLNTGIFITDTNEDLTFGKLLF